MSDKPSNSISPDSGLSGLDSVQPQVVEQTKNETKIRKMIRPTKPDSYLPIEPIPMGMFEMDEQLKMTKCKLCFVLFDSSKAETIRQHLKCHRDKVSPKQYNIWNFTNTEILNKLNAKWNQVRSKFWRLLFWWSDSASKAKSC